MDESVLRQLLSTRFFLFTMKAFEMLHSEPFQASPHVRAICHALEKVASGETTRLLITVPPRHGKSICTSVALPAWMMGLHPSLKIMVASYGSDLANTHARHFRQVVTSPLYKKVFPNMRIEVGGNRLDEQLTTKGGSRKAVSLGGSVTGHGADLIIVDDLLKAMDAISPAERQRCKDFYEQTLISRLNDKQRGRIIVIQQRLHEDDLPGHLIASGAFEHLNLPAIAIRDERIPIGFGEYHQRRKGTALWPEREPTEVLEKLRLQMGNFAFASQYQQDPTPPGGNRIKWEWFNLHDLEDPRREDFEYVAQSWDTGMSAEPTSDFSVGTTWGLRDGNWFLIDRVRERLDFPDLKRRIWREADRWQADIVLIEYAASGIPLLQQLREDSNQGWRFMPMQPRQEKSLRVEAQTARMETGRYLLPAKGHWLEEFRRELTAFPNGRYDDQVDSMVQFIEWSGSMRLHALVPRNPATGRLLRNPRPSRIERPQRHPNSMPQ